MTGHAGFDRTFRLLAANGYTVKLDPPATYRMGARTRRIDLDDDCPYHFAEVRGRGIRAMFCTPHPDVWYWNLAGRFAADNKRCFNKWSQCALVVEFPENNRQDMELLQMLRHLGSNAGLKASRDWQDKLYQYTAYAG